MDKVIKNILIKIESEGYEAYLVGGFVRDHLLGIQSCDIDICTNALPKDLHRIFPKNGNSNNYGGFNLKIKKYNIDITTYRKEIKYENRKPTEIEYINNLLEDLKRRDFTINAICMNKKDIIIDPLNAIDDIHNHIIKIIGDNLQKITEDPLRILRAIRFATVLNFDIDSTLKETIKNNGFLVKKLSSERIKNELSKILISKNCLKGLYLFEELNLKSYLGLEFENVKYASDILVMWAQIKCSKIKFSNVEENNIKIIKKIIDDKINIESLFNYGLYPNIAASEFLNIDKKIIIKMYKKLPIKSEKDINIKTEDILTLLNIKPSIILKNIKIDLISSILNGKLKNNKSEIKKYLFKNKEKWIS